MFCPVVTNNWSVYSVLSNVINEMNARYKAFNLKDYTSIEEFNEKENTFIPRIVVVIDELSDLFLYCKAEIEPQLIRIAQLGRAAGIHLILSTQYPSCKVISSELKSTIPSRICFSLPTVRNSQTILETSGAERLKGNGDGLYRSASGDMIHFQCPYISRAELLELIKWHNAHITEA